MKQKSAQELLKECIDRGIECAMETPLEDCRVPFDIGTEIQFDIWDNIRSEFYFEYESVIKRKTHEDMLMDISDWVNEDDSNTHVAPSDESNRPVAIVREWGRLEWQEDVTPHLGAELYMSPPEQPAWIPLKITERNRIIEEWNSLVDCTVRATKEGRITMLCKMIEAKLKEFNT